MQIFHNIKFDLIITSTYVLMDNFCPCFFMVPNSNALSYVYFLTDASLLNKFFRLKDVLTLFLLCVASFQSY